MDSRKLRILTAALKRLKEIELLDNHRSIADRQRECYNDMKEKIPSDYLLIELDFKQKIKIGLSPRQVGSEFYKQKLRYVLGFGIYYKNNTEKECINVDIISDNLGQTGFSVVSAFRFDIKNLKIEYIH